MQQIVYFFAVGCQLISETEKFVLYSYSIFSEAYTFHIRCFLNCEYSLLNFDDASLRDFFKYGGGETDGI